MFGVKWTEVAYNVFCEGVPKLFNVNQKFAPSTHMMSSVDHTNGLLFMLELGT